MDLTSYGLAKASEKQSVVFANGCGCDPKTSCQDSFTVASTDLVEGFTYTTADGVDMPVTFAAPVSGVALGDAIAAEVAKYEINVMVTAKANGANVDIKHVGQGVVKSYKVGGVDTMAVRSCDIVTVCDYCNNVDDTPTAIEYNGATAPLAGSPYTSAATLQTDVIAALTTLGVTFTSATVELNAVTGDFKVQFSAPSGLTVKIDGKEFFATGCKKQFA